ncbi:hypothetical protein OIV83_001402 [Microbotryomycetes sp. JL201]|nr:hypothetical protein OIV83_001402 [Microbotryomycetes sp. JL201]
MVELAKRRHSIVTAAAAATGGSNSNHDNENGHWGWGSVINSIVLVNKLYAQRGWGPRIGRLLAVCPALTHLSITGVDDLRMKWLVGTGSLKSLRLVSCSFRAHALAEPENLSQFLQSVDSLHLSNLGLPEPSTHLAAIVQNSSSTLVSLALSSVRDPLPPLGPLPHSPALTCLNVTRLTFTIPHVDLTLLSSLPNTLKTLNLRTSPSLSSVFSAQRSEAIGPVPIEQLEEESHVAYILSEALSMHSYSSAPNLETVIWEGPAFRQAAMERKLRQGLDRAGRSHVAVSSESSS